MSTLVNLTSRHFPPVRRYLLASATVTAIFSPFLSSKEIIFRFAVAVSKAINAGKQAKNWYKTTWYREDY